MYKGLIAFLFSVWALAFTTPGIAQDVNVVVGGSPVGGGVPAVLQFGGGVWRVPKVMPWVTPTIMDLRSGGGTYRAALSWEVLAASQSPDDLRARLESYRLNHFLKQVKAKGGQVIISLDAMPKWLAADKSESKMADGPVWAKSVPKSGEEWAGVVQSVVAHFNGELGLDAIYEVWNEPDWSLRGTVDQYLDLYRWSVVGARRADAKARMAGPALSDWTSPGAPGDQFFLQSFLNYAARTPAPEVGLTRLPVDAVTWHAFYRDHSVSYELAAKNIRAWLKASGTPGRTMLILDEWNVASAEPPYPEGDINGGYTGAPYVAAALMAMNAAGIDRQTFQMMVDPGSQGYSGGAFTPAGVARPNFNAFRMFAWLRGKQLPVQTSEEWVRSVAVTDGDHIYLVVAVAPPTDYMLARGVFESLPIDDYDSYKQLARVPKEAVAAYLLKNGPLPDGLSPALAEVLQRGHDQFVAAKKKRDGWKNGVKLHISLDPSLGVKVNSQRALFDRNHAPDAPTVERQTSDLQNVLHDGLEKAQKALDDGGIQPAAKQQYLQALKDTFDTKAAIAGADPSSQDGLRRADHLLTDGFEKQLKAFDSGNLKKLNVEPLSVQGSSIDVQSDAIALHYFVLNR